MINYSEIIKNKTNITPTTILEIGSRDGDDANILKNMFNISNSNVWVVEPNPLQQIEITKKYPNFNLISKPVFNENKTLNFNAVKHNEFIGCSSLLDRIDGLYSKYETDKIVLGTISGFDLLSIIGVDIDICKIDVEGVTFEVIDSFGQKIQNIKSMHIECEHTEIWLNQKLYPDVENILLSNGFVMMYFKYVMNEKLQSDSIWVNKKYIL